MRGTTVALALTVSLAACGGGGDDKGAATPKGFQSTKTDDFSLALPSGWKVDQNDQQGGQGVFVEARPPGSDINRAQLRVASARHYNSDINGAVRYLIQIRVPAATIDTILLASPIIDDVTIFSTQGVQFLHYELVQ